MRKPVTALQPSQHCKQVVAAHEGLRLKAYLCPAGVPTIGYGHTGGVRMGTTITQAQANAYLTMDLMTAGRGVRDMVDVPLSQGEFDALVSFTFNLGAGAVRKSTLIRKLNAGDYAGAAGQFKRWVYGKVNGRNTVLNGLVRRRADEENLFRS